MSHSDGKIITASSYVTTTRAGFPKSLSGDGSEAPKAQLVGKIPLANSNFSLFDYQSTYKSWSPAGSNLHPLLELPQRYKNYLRYINNQNEIFPPFYLPRCNLEGRFMIDRANITLVGQVSKSRCVLPLNLMAVNPLTELYRLAV